MTEQSAYRDNIRKTWIATDDAADRLALVGMNPIRFWDIIRGRRNPSSLDLALLATAFRTTVDTLIGRQPQHVAVTVYDRTDPDHLGAPAEVCDACTNWGSRNLVPASFCDEIRRATAAAPAGLHPRRQQMTDPKRYAWMRDGELVVGTLQTYAHLWETDRYAGDLDAADRLLYWDGTLEPEIRPVLITRQGKTLDGWPLYKISCNGESVLIQLPPEIGVPGLHPTTRP